MTSAKKLFLTDRELSGWFRGTVNQGRFEKCLAFVDAELMNQSELTAEMLRGARLYKRLLTSLADAEDETLQTFPPILNQKFDQLPPVRQPQPKTEKKVNTP